jgi:hypothetical protein
MGDYIVAYALPDDANKRKTATKVAVFFGLSLLPEPRYTA